MDSAKHTEAMTPKRRIVMRRSGSEGGVVLERFWRDQTVALMSANKPRAPRFMCSKLRHGGRRVADINRRRDGREGGIKPRECVATFLVVLFVFFLRSVSAAKNLRHIFKIIAGGETTRSTAVKPRTTAPSPPPPPPLPPPRPIHTRQPSPGRRASPVSEPRTHSRSVTQNRWRLGTHPVCVCMCVCPNVSLRG